VNGVIMGKATSMTDANELRPGGEPSAGELIGQLSEQVSRLVRDELRLARIELTQKGKRIGLGAGLAVAGVVFALFGLGSLLTAAIAAWALIVPVWAGALIVAGIVLLFAGVLGLAGFGQMKRATPPIPHQAMTGLQRDVAAVKEVGENRDIRRGR
jgi:uncharacterized membrane protein YqjE